MEQKDQVYEMTMQELMTELKQYSHLTGDSLQNYEDAVTNRKGFGKWKLSEMKPLEGSTYRFTFSLVPIPEIKDSDFRQRLKEADDFGIDF